MLLACSVNEVSWKTTVVNSLLSLEFKRSSFECTVGTGAERKFFITLHTTLKYRTIPYFFWIGFSHYQEIYTHTIDFVSLDSPS